MAEVGIEWGYTDPREANSRPMTAQEWILWHNPRQGCVMLAFQIEDFITPWKDPKPYMPPAQIKGIRIGIKQKP